MELKIELNEETLGHLLPENIRQKSRRFFTPVDIAIQAAKWLSGEDKRKVLDIGAGFGKFCLFGAYHTQSKFYGIEMRPHLVKIAGELFEKFNVTNAKMLKGNILDFKFYDFEAVYLYNPFHENLLTFLRMDNSILLSPEYYNDYVQHTREQLSLAKAGTRLVTYHGNNSEVPADYKVTEQFRGGDLKYWIKEK